MTRQKDMDSGIMANTPGADLVQWVDPNIGCVSHLLEPTIPVVQLPHGMIRLAPNRTPGHPDPWLADHIVDFPLNITTHRGRRAFGIMAQSGKLCLEPGAGASEADHDYETAAPHQYSVLLESPMITVSYTATSHAMAYRFRFEKPGLSHIVLATKAQGFVEIMPAQQAVCGQETADGLSCYFHARFSLPFAMFRTGVSGQALHGNTRADGPGAAAFAAYDFANMPQTVEVRVGFSYISLDQARANMEEAAESRTFEQLSAGGYAAWNDALRRISVEGGTDRQRRVFYTALWRCHERPVGITEQGRYYSAYDNQVHGGEKVPFHVDDWLWDTHRGLHPLRLILDPRQESEVLESYARMVSQGEGWAPTFPQVNGNRAAMLGNHCAAVAADAIGKGLKGFDIKTLYKGLRRNAMEGSRIPWYVGPATELDQVYLKHGFFPALAAGQAEWVPQVHPFERRQAVSVTLDHAFDDWCMAELAKALGEDEDAALFARRAMNYRNLYHEVLGVMAPKTAGGQWVEPFDPGFSGGLGGRDYYAECNGYVWTWSVPHDVAGLIALMGGRQRFTERLDGLFNKPLGTWKPQFLNQFPDSTGLIGQFPMGNEPAFLIPYLYLYAGAPWRTQKRVRRLMEMWFDDSPRGICGDDDGGALSAWYVFSALGFYPLCPGRPVYGIGSPLFERVTIQLDTGGIFTIIAQDVSAQNKYVQSATLNGQVLVRPWFTHADLIAGGKLTLVMGDRPNKEWGSRPEDAPPSLSF